MANRLQQLYWALRLLGPGFCLFRTGYAFRRKTGLLKKVFPVARWDQINLALLLRRDIAPDPESLAARHSDNGRHFFFKKGWPPASDCVDARRVIEAADRIREHHFQYFFKTYVDLGQSVNWFYNPATESDFPNPAQHWCNVDFFDSGDIKLIWEPSRFAWAYLLVRAYSITRVEAYAEKFFELFESWLQANPFNTGPNFACGQECAIRLMAMVFAYYGLAGSTAGTPQRQAVLMKAIGLHAERIVRNIAFAISTRTNHSITEAAGLYTAGLLFPEFKNARKWLKRGKKTLIEEGLKQIYTDGSYIQHSMNYHRLILQNYIWVLRLAELNNDSFPEELCQRVKKAGEFLFQMQDETGAVPNYGANDGALIIPLNNCDYTDFRPVVGSIHFLFSKKRLYSQGPWDEDILWFFGKNVFDSAGFEIKSRTGTRFDSGGYYTIRSENSWAMIRCHTYKVRPSHADMLHLDLWFEGINVLRDSGTFMYNCQEPWQSYFNSTSSHNTVTIDGLDQMSKGSRFMWFDWTKSKTVLFKSFDNDRIKLFQGEHYGYRKGSNNIIHRRAILSINNYWMIVDDVLGSGDHEVQALWNLADRSVDVLKRGIVLKTEKGSVCLSVISSDKTIQFRCLKGDEKTPAGWESLYYGRRQAVPVFVVSGKTRLPLRIVTLVTLGNITDYVKWSDKNSVLWSLTEIEGENEVLLNSIEQSERSVFKGYKSTFREMIFC